MAIHRASRGIPRVINLICEHSLIFGYVEQIHQIPENIVFAVSEDLDLDTQPFLVSAAGHGGFPTSN
jgi:hypothetical protein